MITWIINVFGLILFASAIWMVTRRKPLGEWVLPSLIIKVFFGLLLGWLYSNHFKGGDTFAYFAAGNEISDYILQDPVNNIDFLFENDGMEMDQNLAEFKSKPRALFFAKIVGVALIFTNANYWLLSIWFSLLSFTGIYYLARRILTWYPSTKDGVVIAFLFLPSFAFWSSGVMKESIVIPSLCFLAAFFLDIYKGNLRHWALKSVLAILSMLVLWKLRNFYLAVMLPLMISALLTQLLTRWIKPLKERSLLPVGFFFIIFIVLILILPRAGYNLRFENVARVVHSNYRQYELISENGKFIRFQNLEPEVSSIVTNAPKALFSALFRPNLWDNKGGLIFLPMILENISLLILFILSILNVSNFKKPIEIIVVSVVLYCAILAVFLALSSPNFGSLSRYRIGFLPFFTYLIWCGSMHTKLHKKFVGFLRNLS